MGKILEDKLRNLAGRVVRNQLGLGESNAPARIEAIGFSGRAVDAQGNSSILEGFDFDFVFQTSLPTILRP